MKGEILGVHPGEFYQDDGDCIFDIYQDKNGIHLVFINLDLDIYYHWRFKKKYSDLTIGRTMCAFDIEPVFLDLSKEITGLLTRQYIGESGTCLLSVSRNDAGVVFKMTDLDMECEYLWEINEHGIVVRFLLGSPSEL